MEKNQEKESEVTSSTNEVYTTMMNWQNNRNDFTEMSTILSVGNMFSFTVTLDTVSNYVHAYPGMINGELFFQIIASEHDKMINFELDSRPADVTTSKVKMKQLPGVGGTIPTLEAIARVDKWNNTLIREEWIDAETKNENMFQAFIIPVDDIVSGQSHSAYFGLRDGEEDDYIADLIIINNTTNEILTLGTTYYDMTRPVPPYKPLLGREKVNFGLLNFVESEM